MKQPPSPSAPALWRYNLRCSSRWPRESRRRPMPTSGTHITIVQRLALDPVLQSLLGNPDPNAPLNDPEGALRMKYACLGAVGPDILYAMADYSSGLQDLENFLLKVQGSFSCLSEAIGEINQYVTGELDRITNDVTASLRETTELALGVIRNQILALLVEAGYNFWPVFEAKRQDDRPREKWYWADYLHSCAPGNSSVRCSKKAPVIRICEHTLSAT
jgi:hypothetical protein